MSETQPTGLCLAFKDPAKQCSLPLGQLARLYYNTIQYIIQYMVLYFSPYTETGALNMSLEHFKKVGDSQDKCFLHSSHVAC